MAKVKGKNGKPRKHGRSNGGNKGSQSLSIGKVKYTIKEGQKHVATFTLPNFLVGLTLEAHLTRMTKTKVGGIKLKVTDEPYSVVVSSHHRSERYYFNPLSCQLKHI
jgi:hypothetical protein